MVPTSLGEGRAAHGTKHLRYQRDRRVTLLAESSAARTLPFLGYLGASAALLDWTHSRFAQCWLAPLGGGLVLNARRTKPHRKQALNGEGGLPHSTRIER